MSLFDFFKPDPERAKRKKNETTELKSVSVQKQVAEVVVALSYNPNLPSTECRTCHKVRNVPAAYFGPLYDCPDCAKITTLQLQQSITERKIDDLNFTLKQLLDKHEQEEKSGQINNSCISNQGIKSGNIGSGSVGTVNLGKLYLSSGAYVQGIILSGGFYAGDFGYLQTPILTRNWLCS